MILFNQIKERVKGGSRAMKIISKLFIILKPFKYDENNPYRRYCKICGQQQDLHAYKWGSRRWWEDMGKIINIKCKCHKYSDYCI